MKDKKSILGEIKDLLFSSKTIEFKEAKSGDFILRVEGEDFVEGADINLVTPDGLIPVEDGTYPLEDGRELYVIGGKIDKIELPEAEESVEEVELAVIEFAESQLLDGTKVKIEGDLAVGNKVLVEKDGEYIQAPEGQHDLADGRVIYVDADGLINEIQTPDTKKVDEEMAIAVEAAPYVEEGVGMTSSINEEVMARLAKCEEMISEMMSKQEQMSNFSKIVEDKLDSFIKDTPAELEFKSIKSDFSSKVEMNKTKADSNLEAIKNIRMKK